MTPEHNRRLKFITRVGYCAAVFEDMPSITVTNVYDGENSEEGKRLRHVIACWNFCRTVTDDVLESNPDGAVAIAEENAKLLRQRNELLTACEMYLEAKDKGIIHASTGPDMIKATLLMREAVAHAKENTP